MTTPEDLTCSFCKTRVPYGAVVCTGCQAEISYGPTSSVFSIAGILAAIAAFGVYLFFYYSIKNEIVPKELTILDQLIVLDDNTIGLTSLSVGAVVGIYTLYRCVKSEMNNVQFYRRFYK